ncbi:MAG: flippase-like domain-containing protein [Bifidobacteriaceae bacterium]|jgi:uncharacterized protein (TIRG00374 family)|nr:flippase-like domain-containing protein [Bifidobacteriaceae bacterium]
MSRLAIKPKTVFTVAVTAIALIIVATQLDFNELLISVTTANPLWMIATVIIAFIALAAAGVHLLIFLPGKVTLRKAIEVQFASGFMSLAAPPGIGPAAVNMRFFNRIGVQGSASFAIVSVIQVIQFIGTILLLFILGALNAGFDMSNTIDPLIIFIVFASVLVLALIALLIPKTRELLRTRLLPILMETLRNFKLILTRPQSMILSLVTVLVTLLLYSLSYYTALLAFDVHVNMMDVILVYVVSNTAATMIPMPGGIGTVEAALTLAFTTLGIPAAVTFSATMLFRFADYWLRIPVGFIAMKMLMKRGDL